MIRCYSPLHCTAINNNQKQSNVQFSKASLQQMPLYLVTPVFFKIRLRPRHVRQGLKAVHGYISAAVSVLMAIAQKVGLGWNDDSRNSACSKRSWWAAPLREPALQFPPMAKPVHHLCIPPATWFLLWHHRFLPAQFFSCNCPWSKAVSQTTRVSCIETRVFSKDFFQRRHFKSPISSKVLQRVARAQLRRKQIAMWGWEQQMGEESRQPAAPPN